MAIFITNKAETGAKEHLIKKDHVKIFNLTNNKNSTFKKQSRLDAWDKCSGLVHWDDPEGWDGERGGRGDWDGEHM